MPADERATRAPARCDLHPGSSSVARCDRCGRPLCLSCAIPVRGRTLGSECLTAVLGPDAPDAPEPAPRQPGTGARSAAVAALTLALAATFLPWSRFGPGSGAFGAWASAPRWSMLAAVAAAAGLGLWLLRRLPLVRVVASDGILAGFGALVAAAALLSLLRPPAFTRPSVGPWVALASGAVTACAGALAHRRAGGPRA